jgi:tetratricopeptide (TPR) repeat protein
MVASDPPRPDDVHGSLAAGLAEEARAAGEPIRTTLRGLRSALGEQRMTLARRQELEAALRAAGLDPPTLDRVGLDEPLVIPVRRGPSLWRRLRRHPVPRTVKRIVGLVVAVLAFAATVAQLWPLVHHAPPGPMTGDLNLAVAQVSGGPDADAGNALAASLSRTLGDLVRGAEKGATQPDVQVRGPERSDIVATASGPERTGQAAALASRLKADVVIYVRVARRASHTLIIPTIYLSAERLSGAEELASTYELAPIDAGDVPLDSAITARARVRQDVAHRLGGLLDLSYGLSFFAEGDWKAARQRFRAAADVWTAGAPGALAEVLLGNAEGKLHDLDRAERAYDAALTVDQGFDRARLGLAEVSLQRADGGCARNTDEKALLTASGRFAALTRVAAPAPAPSLPADAFSLRAWLGRGRTDACLSQIGVTDRWAAARTSFRHVLELAGRHEGRFAAERAEAHAGLGLAAMPAGPRAPGARAAYAEARREYGRAEQLSPYADRRKVFGDFVTYIDQRLAELGR